MFTQERIKILRKQQKLSQSTLAEMIGVSRVAVVAWENGRYQPEGENLKNLAKALNTTVSYLIGETDTPTYERPKKVCLDTPPTLLIPQGTEYTTGFEEAATKIASAQLSIHEALGIIKDAKITKHEKEMLVKLLNGMDEHIQIAKDYVSLKYLTAKRAASEEEK